MAVFFAGTASAGPLVGILGDVHGDTDGFRKALERMRDLGVTHLIGTGDFIGWGNAAELDGLLRMMQDITGVGPTHTYLMPGNWEHKAKISSSEANAVLSKHGELICAKYDGYGYVSIGSIRIFVSHFPQHPIPESLIPPRQFLRRHPGQAFLLDTMARKIYPDERAAFGIFAHNHIRGHYVDPVAQKVIINAGVIDPRTKSPTEERAFAAFDGAKGLVTFYSVDRPGELGRADINDRNINPETLTGLRGCSRIGQEMGVPGI